MNGETTPPALANMLPTPEETPRKLVGYNSLLYIQINWNALVIQNFPIKDREILIHNKSE